MCLKYAMATYEVNQEFPFNKMVLGQPQAMQGGGSYFTKLTIDNSPILMQLPKCNMKSGIVKTKRITYCDLMYNKSNFDNKLSEWIEHLEESCQDLIDTKKHLWFSNELTKDDLETMMSSLVRLYKSGTKALIRTYIDVSRRNGNLKCNIYDENERIVDSNTITDKTQVIPLVQIEGIKFTSRSFDVELKLVQLMVLEEKEEINFNKNCMIKIRPSISTEKITVEKSLEDDNLTVSSQNSEAEEISLNDDDKKVTQETDEINDTSVKDTIESLSEPESINKITLEDVEEKETSGKSESILGNDTIEEVELSLDNLDNAEVLDEEEEEESISSLTEGSLPDLEEITLEVKDELSPKAGIEEVELNIKDNTETITLKRPNEVYYEIYKAAREKAKHMRKVALEAYLAAKQIKTKYMLEDLDDSDEEFDFTENEMSGLSSV